MNVTNVFPIPKFGIRSMFARKAAQKYWALSILAQYANMVETESGDELSSLQLPVHFVLYDLARMMGGSEEEIRDVLGDAAYRDIMESLDAEIGWKGWEEEDEGEIVDRGGDTGSSR